jgi:hypothetical protein
VMTMHVIMSGSSRGERAHERDDHARDHVRKLER